MILKTTISGLWSFSNRTNIFKIHWDVLIFVRPFKEGDIGLCNIYNSVNQVWTTCGGNAFSSFARKIDLVRPSVLWPLLEKKATLCNTSLSKLRLWQLVDVQIWTTAVESLRLSAAIMATLAFACPKVRGHHGHLWTIFRCCKGADR